MAKTPKLTCENCGKETVLTIRHILVECPHYRLQRLRAFSRTTVTLKDLLNTGDTIAGGTLYRYLISISMLNQI